MWRFGGEITIFREGRVAVRVTVAVCGSVLVAPLSELMVGFGVGAGVGAECCLLVVDCCLATIPLEQAGWRWCECWIHHPRKWCAD